jgi:CheY-like chemotaxis protein
MMATGKARGILVVDDEPDVCACLSRLLQEHGFAVTCTPPRLTDCLRQ